MTSDLQSRIIAYKTTLSVFKSMKKNGVITEEEYAKIDTILLKENGLNSCSIFRG